MRKTIVGILAGLTVAVGYVPAAEAASFLRIDVGGTVVSCDNSVALCGAGFQTVIGGNTIVFTGTVNGVSFGDAANFINGIQLVGNQPGGATAQSTDTKTTVTNNSGSSRLVTVEFASNNFSLPVGTPIFFNAAQGVDVLSSSTAMSSGFTGWGDGSNSLVPGTGAASVTPQCLTIATPPTNSCATNGPQNSFVRTGNFALNGREIYTLANGATINAHGSITAFANPVPEPGSMLLLGTGLLALGTTVRRRLGKK